MLNNKTQLHNIPIKSSDKTTLKYLINHTITPIHTFYPSLLNIRNIRGRLLNQTFQKFFAIKY